MIKKAFWFVPVFFCLVFAPGCFAAGNFGALVQKSGNSTINWETGRIEAKGFGHQEQNASEDDIARQLAHRIAAGQARGNLLSGLKSMRLDNEFTIGGYLDSNQDASSAVSGFLQNTKQTEVTYLSNGTIEVEDSVSLRGELADLVLPPSVQFASARSVDENRTDAPALDSLAENATGVILDARGLDLVPALLPRVVNGSGYELYGPIYLTRSRVLQQGVAGYFVDMQKAMSTYRAGENPVVLRVAAVSGAQSTDMVLAPEEAFRLKSLGAAGAVLTQGRVLVVVDDPDVSQPAAGAVN